MERISGTDRHVMIGKRYTAKIARFNSKGFLSYAVARYRKRGFRSVINEWNVEKVDNYKGMKWHLFHGVAANRRERKLAKLFDVITPTRSILFGLVNLQPTTKDVPVGDKEIGRTFIENMMHPRRDVPGLGHMLEEPANFGIYEGEVKFRDGGSRELERTLEREDGYGSVSKALGALTAKYCQTESIS